MGTAIPGMHFVVSIKEVPMTTVMAPTREQVVESARRCIDTIMNVVGQPATDVETQVRLLIRAHEDIQRLLDHPEHRDDSELDWFAVRLRSRHQEVSGATAHYVVFPIDAIGTYFGVPGVQCNGYTTYIAREPAALQQMVANAAAGGYQMTHLGPSESGRLDLHTGKRYSHIIMLYGPVM